MTQPLDVSPFHRHVNILNEISDRRKLSAALKSLRELSLSLSSDQISSLLHLELLKPLLHIMTHQTDSIREQSANFMIELITQADDLSPCMPLISATLVARMGQKHVIESSEEIRLLLLGIMKKLIDKSHDRIAPFVQDFVVVLKQSLLDTYPDAIKESCKCLASLSIHAPKALKYHVPDVAKHLAPALTHRHAQVRVHAVQASQHLVLCELDALEIFSKHYWALSRDKSPVVRGALYDTITVLCIQLIDRYSVGFKLLPYLLSGLEDEIPELSSKTRENLNAIGELYQNEWPDRVKSEMEMLPLNLPPPYPRIGTRHVFRDNTMKTVDLFISNSASWAVEEREQSVKILYHLVAHVQGNITGYTSKILQAFMKMCNDEEHVVMWIYKTCSLIGSFVPPTVYFETCLQSFEMSEGVNLKISCLMLLKHLLHGSSNIPDLDGLCRVFQEKEIWLDDRKVQNTVLDLFITILQKFLQIGEKTRNIEEIFKIILRIKALSPDLENSKECLRLFGEYSNTSLEVLYSSYLSQVIKVFVSHAKNWTRFTPEFKVLEELIGGCDNLSIFSQDICNIIKSSNGEIQKDLFIIIRKALSKGLIIDDELIENLIEGCVWKAGKSEADKRRECLDCIDSILLQDLNISQDKTERLFKGVLSNMDDDRNDVRKSSIKAIEKLLRVYIPNEIVLREVCEMFVKRLDDPDDTLRVSVILLFREMMRINSKMGEYRFDAGMVGYISKTLILHMDDPEEGIRNAVMDVFLGIYEYLGDDEKKIVLGCFRDAENVNRHGSYLVRLVGVYQQD